jgi:hypothetical protein
VENVYLNQGPVFVSNSRVVLHGVTYVVAQINSVRLITIPPKGSNYLWAAMLFVAGCFAAMFCFVVSSSILTREDGELAAKAGIAAVALIALGVAVWRGNKSEYAIGLTTSSGEVVAIRNRDHTAVQHLLSAIQHAIVSRG